MNDQKLVVPLEKIQSQIITIRGEKVLLDNTLADLYGVETKHLKRAVQETAIDSLLISCSNFPEKNLIL